MITRQTRLPHPVWRTQCEREMDTIRTKWEYLLQCRPNFREMIGRAKFVGGHISYNDKQEKIFNFITTSGRYTYNERTDAFEHRFKIV